MCGHVSGMIGFPLRLLAREVYDRVVAIKGAAQVALITGEEKILPDTARYFLCTAESMPTDREVAFVAIDEGQVGADPARGHVFTDRLLHMRGYAETMILGSETLRPLIRRLLPDAEIVTRPRFSTLSYAEPKKLSRLPRRTAIVAFTAAGGLCAWPRCCAGTRAAPRWSWVRSRPARATPRWRCTSRARSTTSSPPTPSAWGSTWTSPMSPSPR